MDDSDSIALFGIYLLFFGLSVGDLLVGNVQLARLATQLGRTSMSCDLSRGMTFARDHYLILKHALISATALAQRAKKVIITNSCFYMVSHIHTVHCAFTISHRFSDAQPTVIIVHVLFCRPLLRTLWILQPPGEIFQRTQPVEGPGRNPSPLHEFSSEVKWF
jgi:hypothetical protein